MIITVYPVKGGKPKIVLEGSIALRFLKNSSKIIKEIKTKKGDTAFIFTLTSTCVFKITTSSGSIHISIYDGDFFTKT